MLDDEPDSKYNNVHLDYGTAFGVGLQTLLETQGDLETAIWKMMLTYNYANETVQKCELSLIAALQSFHSLWDYSSWKLISSELSFKLVLDKATQDYFCGYVDAVVQNIHSGIYAVIEAKTTGMRLEKLEPMYSNSPQGIGYSLVLDAVVAGEKGEASWTILYLVNQLKFSSHLPTLHIYPFEKTRKDKLEWLLTLQLDYKRMLGYRELGFWPKRGDHCMTYNRPCPLYGVCDIPMDGHEGMIKQEDDWDYTFDLGTLLEQQMQRG